MKYDIPENPPFKCGIDLCHTSATGQFKHIPIFKHFTTIKNHNIYYVCQMLKEPLIFKYNVPQSRLPGKDH